MPEPVVLLDGAVEYEDTVKISWNFKANLSELGPKGITIAGPGRVPLPGNWQLQLRDEADDPDELRVSFQHGALPVGVFGKSVIVDSNSLGSLARTSDCFMRLPRTEGRNQNSVASHQDPGPATPSHCGDATLRRTDSGRQASRTACRDTAARSSLTATFSWTPLEATILQQVT